MIPHTNRTITTVVDKNFSYQMHVSTVLSQASKHAQSLHNAIPDRYRSLVLLLTNRWRYVLQANAFYSFLELKLALSHRDKPLPEKLGSITCLQYQKAYDTMMQTPSFVLLLTTRSRYDLPARAFYSFWSRHWHYRIETNHCSK